MGIKVWAIDNLSYNLQQMNSGYSELKPTADEFWIHLATDHSSVNSGFFELKPTAAWVKDFTSYKRTVLWIQELAIHSILNSGSSELQTTAARI
ncbi:hypothetical protein CDAR_98131 [Caerostris darwini]|uniref:Uncharacterized protein n=1 Tax=Caerostris darwini TaxID=1538125 RepID=A0AAV4UFN7_9ARAC|nr:hypothetical protein CDAR_98131 [Caerostris darwini]